MGPLEEPALGDPVGAAYVSFGGVGGSGATPDGVAARSPHLWRRLLAVRSRGLVTALDRHPHMAC